MCRDLPLLRDAAAVNASFLTLPVEANGFPTNATLYQFLSQNFNLVPGSDFDEVTPDDFSSDPEGFLPNVTDSDIRNWALSVNDLWQTLCREVRALRVWTLKLSPQVATAAIGLLAVLPCFSVLAKAMSL